MNKAVKLILLMFLLIGASSVLAVLRLHPMLCWVVAANIPVAVLQVMGRRAPTVRLQAALKLVQLGCAAAGLVLSTWTLLNPEDAVIALLALSFLVCDAVVVGQIAPQGRRLIGRLRDKSRL